MILKIELKMKSNSKLYLEIKRKCKFVERIIKTERQCWENAQYSRRDTLEIVGIPYSVDNSVLEETVRGVFKKIGVEIDERYVQACHRLKKKG